VHLREVKGSSQLGQQVHADAAVHDRTVVCHRLLHERLVLHLRKQVCECQFLPRDQHVFIRHSVERMDVSEGIWLSGKTLGCRPKDCELEPPHPTQIIKKRYVLVLPSIPCISALHWAR